MVLVPGHDGFDDLHREMGEICHHALDVAVVEPDIGDDIVDRGPGPSQGRVPSTPVWVALDLNRRVSDGLHVCLSDKPSREPRLATPQVYGFSLAPSTDASKCRLYDEA